MRHHQRVDWYDIGAVEYLFSWCNHWSTRITFSILNGRVHLSVLSSWLSFSFVFATLWYLGHVQPLFSSTHGHQMPRKHWHFTSQSYLLVQWTIFLFPVFNCFTLFSINNVPKFCHTASATQFCNICNFCQVLKAQSAWLVLLLCLFPCFFFFSPRVSLLAGPYIFCACVCLSLLCSLRLIYRGYIYVYLTSGFATYISQHR